MLAALLELGLCAAKLVTQSRHLGLARCQQLLAPSQLGLPACDPLGLGRVGEPVPDRREPAPLGAQGPDPPTETPFAQRELPLGPVELPLAHGDRGGPFAQHLLQVCELIVGARPVVTALKNPLRHRASNVHALCGNRAPQYDRSQWGRTAPGLRSSARQLRWSWPPRPRAEAWLRRRSARTRTRTSRASTARRSSPTRSASAPPSSRRSRPGAS